MYDVALAEIHANATSEKLAMGYYLDGRAAAVWGTHTHVQTADERVNPKGTGYITDIGMTGRSCPCSACAWSSPSPCFAVT